jgi:predicted DNA-binding protein (MmcQ/YjbR family)
MHIESFREYCLSKPGVTEEFPFDITTLVFKVGGKMFALTDLEDEFAVSLKCDPEYSITLQELHPQIAGAYHMNKKHWISVSEASSIDEKLLKKLIDESYELVFKSLPRKISSAIGQG